MTPLAIHHVRDERESAMNTHTEQPPELAVP